MTCSGTLADFDFDFWLSRWKPGWLATLTFDYKVSDLFENFGKKVVFPAQNWSESVHSHAKKLPAARKIQDQSVYRMYKSTYTWSGRVRSYKNFVKIACGAKQLYFMQFWLLTIDFWLDFSTCFTKFLTFDFDFWLSVQKWVWLSTLTFWNFWKKCVTINFDFRLWLCVFD